VTVICQRKGLLVGNPFGHSGLGPAQSDHSFSTRPIRLQKGDLILLDEKKWAFEFSVKRSPKRVFGIRKAAH